MQCEQEHRRPYSLYMERCDREARVTIQFRTEPGKPERTPPVEAEVCLDCAGELIDADEAILVG
jgi:hypothetical protein